MNDEVRNAAFIGASINSGLGGIPAGKKKTKNNKEDDKKTTSETTATEAPKETKQTKQLPKPKNPSSKKPKQATGPVFVKSERINKPSEPSGPKPINFIPKELPTYGPGSEFNPNRGRQFNG
jgi:hypothetical protein